MPKSEWLDSMAFRKMEEIHAVSAFRYLVRLHKIAELNRRNQAETEKSENLYLYIDLPRFDFPVIFSEPVSSPAQLVMNEAHGFPQDASSVPSTSTASSTAATPAPPTSSFTSDVHLWQIVDPDIARENPVEDKHRRLVRSHRSSPYDRELKPNAKIRDELSVCATFASLVPIR